MGNVFYYVCIKQRKLLEHRRKQRVIIPPVQRFNVLAVKQHPALRRVKEAAYKLYKRCFARAVKADYCKLFARVNGQIKALYGILLSPYVAIAHVFKPYFAGHIAALFNALPAFKVKGLLPFKVIAQLAYIKALPMQRAEFIQYARYPLGKAANRAEIEQELRRAKAVLKRVPYKVGIGRAVAQKRKRNVYHVAPYLHPSLPYGKRTVQPQRLNVQLLYPVGKAEHANIFGVAPLYGNAVYIFELFVVFHALLAVAVAPFVYAL